MTFLGACLFILVRQADKLPAGLGTVTELQLHVPQIPELQDSHLFLCRLPLLLLALGDGLSHGFSG